MGRMVKNDDSPWDLGAECRQTQMILVNGEKHPQKCSSSKIDVEKWWLDMIGISHRL